MSRLKGVTAVLVLLVFGFFSFGCGGGDDGATREQLEQARQEGAQQEREKAKLKQLQRQVNQLQNQAKNGSRNTANRNSNAGRGDGYYESGSSGGGPVSTCATGVQVGPNTSCSFAMNVAGEYGSNPGAATISAYSPTTGQHYTMSCGPWGSGTVCTGGNNASVYLP